LKQLYFFLGQLNVDLFYFMFLIYLKLEKIPMEDITKSSNFCQYNT